MNLNLQSLNPFDWLLIAILAYSTISAFLTGIVVELFSLGGLIAGIFLASWHYQRFAPALQQLLHPLFKPSASTCNILAFLTIALGIMVVAAIAARSLRGAARTVGLGFFDRLFGALFGLVRGCILGVSLLMAAAAFLPQSTWIANSRLTPYFLAGVHAVSFVVPQGLQQQLQNGIAQLKHTAPDWIKLHR
jgi:membrane protein required for colicin V production